MKIRIRPKGLKIVQGKIFWKKPKDKYQSNLFRIRNINPRILDLKIYEIQYQLLKYFEFIDL